MLGERTVCQLFFVRFDYKGHMYYPETILELGISSPKAHQRIIGKLMASLGHLFYHLHQIALEPLPETQIDEGQSSPVPDIMLYDNETFQTPIIIEVCHPNGVNNDLKKIIKLIDANDFGIEEGFIYDYERGLWLNYQKGIGQVFDKPSFSTILGMDLASLL
jgi:Uma2 family endonuclease